jgi:hypothetical protein
MKQVKRYSSSVVSKRTCQTTAACFYDFLFFMVIKQAVSPNCVAHFIPLLLGDKFVMPFAVPPSSSWQPSLSCQATSFTSLQFARHSRLKWQISGAHDPGISSLRSHQSLISPPAAHNFRSPAGRLGLRLKSRTSAQKQSLVRLLQPCVVYRVANIKVR